VTVGSSPPYINIGNSFGAFGTHDFSVAFNFKTTATDNHFDVLGNRVQAGHGNFFSVRMVGSGSNLRICVEIDQDAGGTNFNSVCIF